MMPGWGGTLEVTCRLEGVAESDWLSKGQGMLLMEVDS